jgi:lipopolysaccharide transport system ATP-binding protein
MTDIAIRVRNLSKCYQIYNQPQDRLKQSLYPRLQRLAGKAPKQYFREFWALNDVSFEVKKGETVGIIGRNGAGKSTLLQILCGTLTPSGGSVEVTGRVAALLELGSGFNAEFTGRENVYMNASVLGLSQEEINARFDEIVAFADIGIFIDQPVKTYSSGMYVRLAFAVIVHVDADILIIDEALAVGDMYFQAKCQSHIKKLMSSGVTVLFVSHDVGSVKALCSRAVYLEHGKVVAMGGTKEVVEAYYGGMVRKKQGIIEEQKKIKEASGPVQIGTAFISVNEEFSKRAAFHRIQNGKADFINIVLLDENEKEVRQVDFGTLVQLRMVFRANVPMSTVGVAYHIRDKNGFDLVYSDTCVEKCDIFNVNAGELIVVDWKFIMALRSGDFTIAANLSIPIDLDLGHVEVCDFVPLAFQVQVGRGEFLPIYGAVHWDNQVTLSRIVNTVEGR